MKRLSVNLELLEIMHSQYEIIENQKKLIAKLVNENAEQENMINELMRKEGEEFDCGDRGIDRLFKRVIWDGDRVREFP